MKSPPFKYPIELDLGDRLAVVIGLGSVGRRKALGLLEAGARVRGVDPAGWAEAPERLEVKVEAYRPEHLEGAFLVFAAVSEGVDRQVAADAKALGLLVSSASVPESGNFQRPAVRRDGGLTLTVSTSGASPALAVALLDRAAEALGPGAGELARLFGALRPQAFERLSDPRARRRVLADWGDPRWLTLLESGGHDAVIREFNKHVDRETHGNVDDS